MSPLCNRVANTTGITSQSHRGRPARSPALTDFSNRAPSTRPRRPTEPSPGGCRARRVGRHGDPVRQRQTLRICDDGRRTHIRERHRRRGRSLLQSISGSGSPPKTAHSRIRNELPTSFIVSRAPPGGRSRFLPGPTKPMIRPGCLRFVRSQATRIAPELPGSLCSTTGWGRADRSAAQALQASRRRSAPCRFLAGHRRFSGSRGIGSNRAAA
jgi:hypothetical protein